MSIAKEIIARDKAPDFQAVLRRGESLDDIDEYGFTPLIETIITRQPAITLQLLQLGVDINKPDVTGRSPLHWAVDNYDIATTELLLQKGANTNAYTQAGMPVLVFPILRRQNKLKHLLYQHNAKLDFALDFIQAKLLGHRFELTGRVDLHTGDKTFIELNYEGFILEFTIAVIKDSLHRFTSSFSTRHLRPFFPLLYTIMDAFEIAAEFLQLQCQPKLLEEHHQRIAQLLQEPMLILPAASMGHAIGFVRYKNWLAKIDRGENSKREGTVNIYRITRLDRFDRTFILDFLYKKQPQSYFHHHITSILGLVPSYQLDIPAQITGNCSWANIQAIVPAAIALQELEATGQFSPEKALLIGDSLVEWDKERALDETIKRFYLADPLRKTTIVAMLADILFQACDYNNGLHLQWAEKILRIITMPQYLFILNSYLEEYCSKRLTPRGNNLLKILDDCGYNPNIGVSPIASGLNKKKK